MTICSLVVSGSMVLPLLALLVITPAAETAGQTGGDDIFPEAEFVVAPCCTGTVEHPGADTVLLASQAQAIRWEGEPFDEETMRRIRERAAINPPIGRDLGQPIGEDTIQPSAPKIRTKFNGHDLASVGGWLPPDTQVAAGPDHVLQAVNSALQLSNKTGGEVIRQTSNEHFGLDAAEFLFDPKVHYDPQSGRFFVLFVRKKDKGKISQILLSVSRSSSPSSLTNANWCNYSINARKGNTWADYPGLGMNEQWVAINTNNFSFMKDSFKESLFFVTDTATIVDNTTNCPNITIFRLRPKKKDNSRRWIFTPQVAQHHTATNIAGTPLFAVNSQYGSGTGYALWRITNGERDKPRLNHDVITASGYRFPPNAMQKGSKIPLDTLGNRMMAQVVYRDGQLWLAHTSGCTVGTGTELLSCIRVVQMFPTANGATVGFEDLFGIADHYVWVPGISVTASGDVIVAFQYAGKKKHLSIAYNGLRQGAARFGPARLPELFDREKVLASGKCTVEGGSGGGEYAARTGDYVGVISDPSSSKDVWISGEFSGKSAGVCDWFTKIARVSY